MIGFLFVLVVLAAILFESHRKSKDENYSKHNPVNIHGEKSYYDKDGIQRLLSNDKKVNYSIDPWTGDFQSFDGDSRKQLRNFSAEEREKQNARALEEARLNGEKYYLYRMEGDNNSFYDHKVKGMRYMNIENGRLYVQRMVPPFICNGHGSSFYMDVENGMYEDTIYYNEKYKTPENIKRDEEVKKKFNEWREKVKDKGDYYNLMDWSYR